MVGQGAYGKIFKGKCGSDIAALKVFSFVEDDDIIKEAKFLSRLNHPNIVQVKGICLQESCMMLEYILFDLKQYGSNSQVHSIQGLMKYLARPGCYNYDKLILDVAKGLLDGLTFLHDKGVAQRDLKPSNVLISNAQQQCQDVLVKLCDFGESWGNIVESTQCFKTHTVKVYKGKIKDFLLISMCWHDLEEEIP